MAHGIHQELRLHVLPEPRQETNEDAGRTETVGKIPGMVKSEFSRETENLDFHVQPPDFQMMVMISNFFINAM